MAPVQGSNSDAGPNAQTAQNLPRYRRVEAWVPPSLCLLTFLLDLITPRGVAMAIAYIPQFSSRFWSTPPKKIFVFAATATILTVVAVLVEPTAGVALWMELLNRALTIGVFWFAARLVYRRRTAEDALQGTVLQAESIREAADQQKALLATIVESSTDAILSKTLQGEISSWNGGAERLFGYTAEEAIGKSVTMLIPDELRQDEARILAELGRGHAVEQFETTRLHKSGRRIDVSVSVAPVRDASGKIIGASNSTRDITARKKIEARLRAVIDYAFDGLITIDERGAVESFNPAGERIFGYAEEELLGRNINILMPEPYHSEHDGYLSHYAATGEAKVVGTSGREVSGRRKDGSVFPMELSISAFRLEDGRHFSGIIRDITAKKKAEAEMLDYTRALVRSNQDLDEFAYAASHDLKAPLRVIDNASKWLEEDLEAHLTPDTRENMQLLRGRVRRMEKLLNDLLDYSRIGRKSDEHYTELLSGDELMTDVLALISTHDGFSVNVNPAFADIRVYRMPLQQIFMNLISNAMKHHDRDTGQVEVTVAVRPAEFLFCVKDDGPGIPARFHDQIFKMFQTLKPRDQVEGSGMGLAMVRKHVEVSGGKIWIESTEGAGCAFWFTWPRDPREGPGASPRANFAIGGSR